MKVRCQNRQKLVQLPHDTQGFLSVSQVAKCLGISVDTEKRWCETGKLPAVPKPYGIRTTFLVPSTMVHFMLQTIEKSRQVPQSSAKIIKPHSEYFDSWIRAMQRGLITGRPFSPLTIRDYESFVRDFLTSHKDVSSKTLEKALFKIPPTSYAKRFKLYTVNAKGVVRWTNRFYVT